MSSDDVVELDLDAAGPNGTYPCTFRHYYIDPDPAHDYDGECGVSLASNTSANRDAWTERNARGTVTIHGAVTALSSIGGDAARKVASRSRKASLRCTRIRS